MNCSKYSSRKAVILSGLATAFALACAGCPQGQSASPSPTPVAEPKQPTVVFPEDIQADDPEVNAFIRDAIETGLSGDYEAFRLLWTARQDPPTRVQYERGWQAQRKLEVSRLQKIQTPDGEIVYGVLGEMQFDPDQVPQPERIIVLMLVQENGAWRLAQAPGEITALLKKQAGITPSPKATPQAEAQDATDDGAVDADDAAPSPAVPPTDREQDANDPSEGEPASDTGTNH